MKRIFGYILIGLSVLLAMAFLGQLPQIVGDLKALAQIVHGELDAYDTTYTLTTWVMRILLILLTVTLWKQGRKWSKKQ